MLRLWTSWRESGKVPKGWAPVRSSGAVIKVPVKNSGVRKLLRELKPGKWRKVYRKGRDGSEVHYFEHESGMVADVKHKVN